MSKYDDEFKSVRSGTPPESKTPASFNFLFLFIVVGVVFALTILALQNPISDTGAVLQQSDFGRVSEQAIINGVLALLVGSVQAWIFKSRIRTRIPLFVGFALLGGIAGGVAGGLAINSGVRQAFLIGAVNGGIAGAVSSLCQNSIMGNIRYGSRWLVYSVISWMIIFSIGWTIGWKPQDVVPLALAAAFLVICSGIGLALFFKSNPTDRI